MKIGIKKIEPKKIINKILRFLFWTFVISFWLTLSLFNTKFFWQIPIVFAAFWLVFKFARFVFKFIRKEGINDNQITCNT